VCYNSNTVLGIHWFLHWKCEVRNITKGVQCVSNIHVRVPVCEYMGICAMCMHECVVVIWITLCIVRNDYCILDMTNYHDMYAHMIKAMPVLHL